MNVLSTIKSYFVSLDKRRRYYVAITPTDDLVKGFLDFVTAICIIILIAVVMSSLAGCKGQKINMSDGGHMVRLYCINIINDVYMNSEAIRKFERQGLNPCDCVKRYSRCRMDGPQVVPQIIPPPWKTPKSETIFKGKTGKRLTRRII